MIKGIEGARGWLALIVVFAHILELTTLHRLPHAEALERPGDWAVRVFIIISGFVIANLLLRKREGYPIYIARRALRIYPAYLFSLLLGFLVLPLAGQLDAFGDPAAKTAMHFQVQAASYAAAPSAHWLLHLTMLHGAVPNNILAESQYMFNPPAWSLSLEWQFYLLAPAVLLLAQRRPMILVASVIALGFLYRRGLFGQFYNPSLIFGAGWLFLLGVFSCLMMERLPRFGRFPWTLLLLAVPLVLMNRELPGVVGWIGLLAYIRSDAQWCLLDGRLAVFLGARSYAIYILHVPVLLACCWLAYHQAGLAGYPAAILAGVLTVAATFAGAELAYRFVERPAIAFGKRLGREPGRGSQGW